MRGSKWQPVAADELVRCGNCGVEPLLHVGRRLVVVSGDAAAGYYANIKLRHECLPPLPLLGRERTGEMTGIVLRNELAVRDGPSPLAPLAPVDPGVLEAWLGKGDLKDLTPAQRVAAYRAAAESMGLNPLTRPFDFLETRDHKIQLYPNAVAAQQLRQRHGVSVRIVGRELLPGGEVYVVTARATDRHGREDEATGALYVKGVTGQALADAFMKAEQKAKRRVTLSICGLGWAVEADESWQRPIRVDTMTGEIVDLNPQPAAVAALTLDQSGDGLPPSPPLPLPELVARYRTLIGRCRDQGIGEQDIGELTGTVRRPQLEPEIARLQQLLQAVQGTPPPEVER